MTMVLYYRWKSRRGEWWRSVWLFLLQHEVRLSVVQ